jgi:phage recombination protein Bet
MTGTMTTTTAADNSLTHDDEQAMMYIPLGEKAPIRLTLKMIAHDIATPTKSGQRPSEGDCLRFANLCKGRELNPWTGDCFMIGYDSQGGPNFELITAYQALLKRAERSDKFDGLEGGVTVKTADGLEHRKGCLVMNGEVIVGGWAKAYRQDRRIPHEAIIDFKVYDAGRSRWKVDPAGMIAKCAKAAALREAFPNQVGGLYLQEEMDRVHEDADLGAVIAPQRIEAQPVEREQDHAEPVDEKPTPKPKAKPKAKKATTKTQSAGVDWAAEFTLYGVTDQAVLLRDSPTAADRESVMSAAKSMVGDGEMKQVAFDCLGRYLAELESR